MTSLYGALNYHSDRRDPGYQLDVRTDGERELYLLIIDQDSVLTLHHQGYPYPITRPQLDALWERLVQWQQELYQETGDIYWFPATVLPRAINRPVSPGAGLVYVRSLFVGGDSKQFFRSLHSDGHQLSEERIKHLERIYDTVVVPTLIELGILSQPIRHPT